MIKKFKGEAGNYEFIQAAVKALRGVSDMYNWLFENWLFIFLCPRMFLWYINHCRFFQGCDSILFNENLWNAVKDKKYDLVILDGIMICNYIFPYRLDVPYITIAYTHDPWGAGVPAMPSVEPFQGAAQYDPWEMTFTQRTINFLYFVSRTIMSSRLIDEEYTKRYVQRIILCKLSNLLLRSIYTEDPVSVTVTLTDDTFDLFDRHYDGQNGLHTHFAYQRERIRNGVVRCEQTFRHNFLLRRSGILVTHPTFLSRFRFAPEKPVINPTDLVAKSGIILILLDNMCFDYPRISAPHFQYLSGGGSATPPNPLEGEFEDFVSSAEHGIIILAFGSQESIRMVFEMILDRFLESFTGLKERVIVQYNATGDVAISRRIC